MRTQYAKQKSVFNQHFRRKNTLFFRQIHPNCLNPERLLSVYLYLLRKIFTTLRPSHPFGSDHSAAAIRCGPPPLSTSPGKSGVGHTILTTLLFSRVSTGFGAGGMCGCVFSRQCAGGHTRERQASISTEEQSTPLASALFLYLQSTREFDTI